MKFLLLTAALVAVAVAGPTERLVHIGPDFIEQPIQPGPGIVEENHPISIGPEIVDIGHPISVGPAIVNPPAAASSSPLVQIIVNVNKNGQVVGTPDVVQNPVTVPEPTPVDVVDVPVKPVDVIELPPAIIGTPVLPGLPVVSLPENLN